MLLTPKLCGANEVKSDLGGNYGGRPLEAKPLNQCLNFVCITSGYLLGMSNFLYECPKY